MNNKYTWQETKRLSNLEKHKLDFIDADLVKERFIMTGLKMTTMTTKEMRTAREHGESKTDWALLRQNALDGIEPEDDKDSPDATLLMREAVAKRRAGRPAGSGKKEQVAIRFDKDILSSFRAAGTGWQTRMNDALREWLTTHSHT
jgi:uncharacterized protein (DUF4415 family)